MLLYKGKKFYKEIKIPTGIRVKDLGVIIN